MIRLGRVYEGLMVDVQATNHKLVRRSEDMLMHLINYFFLSWKEGVRTPWT